MLPPITWYPEVDKPCVGKVIGELSGNADGPERRAKGSFVGKPVWVFNCLSLLVPGSIPGGPQLEPWCNGNTSDFGSEIPGSTPGGSTAWERSSMVE